MANPVAALHERLQAAIASALGPEFADADPVVRRSQNPEFGQYQANAAMALGKRVGRSPREVATDIVAHLDATGLIANAEVAGPGFINIRLEDAALEAAAADLAKDSRAGVGAAESLERVIVDYSAPNVAKEMHVGHLRSTIIGDALARVFGFLGHQVIRQNHLGDWGRPFGMLIEHLLDIGDQEAAHELSVGDLTTFYQQANEKFEGDPEFAERARQRVVLLQDLDPETLRHWRLLFEASKDYFNAVYSRLGVLLTDDDIAAESSYNPMLDEVAAELEAMGLAVMDDDALCVFPPGFKGRDGEALPIIVRYRTGGYGYGATDLAAVRYRATQLAADRIVYVVGAPQTHHLSMVHSVGRMAKWLGDYEGGPGHPRAEHVGFGSVLGVDKKMYKTRSGESIKLVDLLDEAVERAAAAVEDKNPDLDATTKAAVAKAIGIGAVKYADLSSDRVKDYVFDWDRMLAFEGNTGPYMQYAHARIQSIFRRAEVSEADAATGAITITEEAERALVLQLLAFGDAVASTAEFLQPHRLTTYLFETASAFTTFYENCPVLRATDESTRVSRLALLAATSKVLRTGLNLLGIEAPDQM
jgi:arginyl-tRNA synthetase